ncbi:hypothetical protein BB561_005102 [Smittium simulii]|uniref:Uncharacterized protein n=1 Tax=Smittium simulii TaxID=133385 RepID=A0A2T9YC61_9FUNG|nr:hypothetical protein BB561_005102 [Smittium simulii]
MLDAKFSSNNKNSNNHADTDTETIEETSLFEFLMKLVIDYTSRDSETSNSVNESKNLSVSLTVDSPMCITLKKQAQQFIIILQNYEKSKEMSDAATNKSLKKLIEGISNLDI